MERKKRVVESDIRRFYSDSSKILKQCLYLNDFYTKDESWSFCISILQKHSICTEKITKPTASLLMYCANVLKLHAYGGFELELSGYVTHKYKRLWEICEVILPLFRSYSLSHAQISAQLASVVSCAVIYGYEASQTESEMLFLHLLSETEDGSLHQFLYLSTLAREAMGRNASLSFGQRCAFLRICVGVSGKVFRKLLPNSRKCEPGPEPYRLLALRDWVDLHLQLLSLFSPVLIEQKSLEASEFGCEELIYPKRRVSDISLVHRSLAKLYEFGTAEFALGLVKYAIGSEEEYLMQLSCELCLAILRICKADLANLLLITAHRFMQSPANSSVSDSECERWDTACKFGLKGFSPIVLSFIIDFVLGISDICRSLLSCVGADLSVSFLKSHTSKWLLDLITSTALEHIPLVLHFNMVDFDTVESICSFVNLYLHSNSLRFRVSALDFWATLITHLCPVRNEISFINSSVLENCRLLMLPRLRPLFTLFISDLYASSRFRPEHDLEEMCNFREAAVDSLRDGVMVAGLDCVLELISADLELVESDFNIYSFERCVYITTCLCTKLAKQQDLVKRILQVGLDRVEPLKFYKNSLFRLITWTSSLISTDQTLLSNTISFLSQNIKLNQADNSLLDQAILSICYSNSVAHGIKTLFIQYLMFSITNYTVLNKTIETFEAYIHLIYNSHTNSNSIQLNNSVKSTQLGDKVNIVDVVQPSSNTNQHNNSVNQAQLSQPNTNSVQPSSNSINSGDSINNTLNPNSVNSVDVDNSVKDDSMYEIKYNLLKMLFNKVKDRDELNREEPELHLFILWAMSSINFLNGEEVKDELVEEVVDFLHKFRMDEQLWDVIVELLPKINFTDKSTSDFQLNNVENNRTSFIFWLFASSKPNAMQLKLIKTLVNLNLFRSQSKLYELALRSLISLTKHYMYELKSNNYATDFEEMELLDCISSLLLKWKLVLRLVEWREIGDFISTLSSTLPRELPNLNHLALTLIGRFVGWANLPKQLYVKSDKSVYSVMRLIKRRVRLILNGKDNSGQIIQNILDTIVKFSVTKGEQIEHWITPASQTIAVLVKCSQTLENTQVTLKNVMKVGETIQFCLGKMPRNDQYPSQLLSPENTTN